MQHYSWDLTMRRIFLFLLFTLKLTTSVFSDMDEDLESANDISRSIEIQNTLGFSEDMTEEQLARRIEQHEKDPFGRYVGKYDCKNEYKNIPIDSKCLSH